MDWFHLRDVKVRWTLMEPGSFNRTATGLMTFWIVKGPTYLGDIFLDSTQRGRSQVGPDPGSATAADEGLDRWAGNLLLLGGEQRRLIAIGTLKRRQARGRADEGVVGIFYPQQL